jgi:hypothetical protein
MQSGIDLGDDPFAGDINFGLFANETGGKLFYNSNNVDMEINPRQQQMIKLAEAVHSTIPFDALSVSLSSMVRHPDTRTAEFTVELKSKNLTFEPSEGGKGIAQLIVAASLNQYGNILASRTQTVTLVAREAVDAAPAIEAPRPELKHRPESYDSSPTTYGSLTKSAEGPD